MDQAGSSKASDGRLRKRKKASKSALPAAKEDGNQVEYKDGDLVFAIREGKWRKAIVIEEDTGIHPETGLEVQCYLIRWPKDGKKYDEYLMADSLMLQTPENQVLADADNRGTKRTDAEDEAEPKKKTVDVSKKRKTRSASKPAVNRSMEVEDVGSRAGNDDAGASSGSVASRTLPLTEQDYGRKYFRGMSDQERARFCMENCSSQEEVRRLIGELSKMLDVPFLLKDHESNANGAKASSSSDQPAVRSPTPVTPPGGPSLVHILQTTDPRTGQTCLQAVSIGPSGIPVVSSNKFLLVTTPPARVDVARPVPAVPTLDVVAPTKSVDPLQEKDLVAAVPDRDAHSSASDKSVELSTPPVSQDSLGSSSSEIPNGADVISTEAPSRPYTGRCPKCPFFGYGFSHERHMRGHENDFVLKCEVPGCGWTAEFKLGMSAHTKMHQAAAAAASGNPLPKRVRIKQPANESPVPDADARPDNGSSTPYSSNVAEISEGSAGKVPPGNPEPAQPEIIPGPSVSRVDSDATAPRIRLIALESNPEPTGAVPSPSHLNSQVSGVASPQPLSMPKPKRVRIRRSQTPHCSRRPTPTDAPQNPAPVFERRTPVSIPSVSDSAQEISTAAPKKKSHKAKAYASRKTTPRIDRTRSLPEGGNIKRKPPVSGKVALIPCPEPGCNFRGSSTVKGLNVHMGHCHRPRKIRESSAQPDAESTSNAGISQLDTRSLKRLMVKNPSFSPGNSTLGTSAKRASRIPERYDQFVDPEDVSAEDSMEADKEDVASSSEKDETVANPPEIISEPPTVQLKSILQNALVPRVEAGQKRVSFPEKPDEVFEFDDMEETGDGDDVEMPESDKKRKHESDDELGKKVKQGDDDKAGMDEDGLKGGNGPVGEGDAEELRDASVGEKNTVQPLDENLWLMPERTVRAGSA